MTEKRFTVEDDDADIWEDNHFLAVAYNHINAKKITKRLNKLADENRQLKTKIKTYNDVHELLKADNQQLKQSVNNLKDTIIKITIAYQRKYDRTIVDLVDEVHDEDITDLIKELQE